MHGFETLKTISDQVTKKNKPQLFSTFPQRKSLFMSDSHFSLTLFDYRDISIIAALTARIAWPSFTFAWLKILEDVNKSWQSVSITIHTRKQQIADGKTITVTTFDNWKYLLELKINLLKPIWSVPGIRLKHNYEDICPEKTKFKSWFHVRCSFSVLLFLLFFHILQNKVGLITVSMVVEDCYLTYLKSVLLLLFFNA